MRTISPGRGTALVLAASLALVTGCSRKTVKIYGRVEKNGQPYPINLTGPKPEVMSVDFIANIEGTQYLLPAKFTTDGSFVVVGGDDRGIRPGLYKVAALHTGFNGEGGDRFQEKFTAAKTPLTLDVSKDTEIVIDVWAGTIVAKQ